MTGVAEEDCMAVRAKFSCTRESTVRWSMTAEPQRVYEFQAAYDAASPEDQRFAKATPSGSLSITVDNPAVSFEPGKYYYIDFTQVEG